MASTQTETRPAEARGRQLPLKRDSRRNEIVAIALLAVGLLLTLCLVFFNPNDPSWNVSAEGPTRNWIGPVGANVAGVLLQSFGLSAYLLPLLLFAAALRRFLPTVRDPWPRPRLVPILPGMPCSRSSGPKSSTGHRERRAVGVSSPCQP